MNLPPDLPDTRVLDADEGALVRAPQRFRELCPGRAALLVADPATWNAAGRELYAAFRAAGAPVARPFVFDAPPRPSLDALSLLLAALESPDGQAPSKSPDGQAPPRSPDGQAPPCPIAVGGGTLADLCKRAAHLRAAPCMVFATAPSSTAFAAPGARLADADGLPADLPCPAPAAVFAEPEILARAPDARAAAGYGEAMACLVAGADWLAAAAIGADAPADPAAWALSRDRLRDRLLHPREVAQGDPAALAELFATLASLGLAAQRARFPRPVYGAPHALADAWALSGAGRGAPRGQLDGFGALCALAAWDALFAEPFSAADADRAAETAASADAREAEVSSLFPAGPLRERALACVRAKLLPPDDLRARLARLASLWDPLREKLDGELMHLPRLRAMLEAAGCAVSPADFGLSPARAGATALAAPMVSSTYTVFDLALETGRLPAVAGAVAGAAAP